MANYLTTDTDLNAVADAIRTKGGTSGPLSFPQGFVDAIGAISGGGGGVAMERGSFIATTADSLTIPVTALYSHIYIYHSTINSNTDLTGAPYGTNKIIFIYADKNNGYIAQGMINYAGTGYDRGFSKIGENGANNISFTDTQIRFTVMRISGGRRPLIDGDTYCWEAW